MSIAIAPYPLNNQVSDWDVDQLNTVANNTHHDKTKANGSDQLEIFLLGWLGTFLNKTNAILDKLNRGFSDLFNFSHGSFSFKTCSFKVGNNFYFFHAFSPFATSRCSAFF